MTIMRYKPKHLKFDMKQTMRKFRVQVVALATVMLLALTVTIGIVTASADSPHFLFANVTRSGDQLTVDFKIAGLGNTDQTITLTAAAECWNRGGNQPQAENKGAVLASGLFSPKNGNIEATLSGSATTDPDCSPPMELRYANVTLTAQPSGESVVLGNF